MALNAGIILQGQGVQPVNALAQGAQAGQMVNDIRHTNAMRDMYKQNGAGIVAGDQGALNALAGFDPQAAVGVQSTRLGMENTRHQMEARSQEVQIQLRTEARQIQEAARQASAAERAKLAQQIEQSVAMGMQAQTPQQWDAIMAERNPDYVGMFDQREMLAAEYMSVADSLKRMDEANAPASPQSSLGKFYADQAAGLVPADQAPPSSGVNVTTNVSNGDPDVFRNELDKKSAEMFTTLYDNLPVAQSKVAQVENLAGLLANSPTGAGAAVKSWLGGFGIETEGLSEIQAVEAAISQMVPQQRPAGSGPMSDADLALFKLSLPRLINTPEGNEKIVRTMRGLASYEAAQAQIAAKVVSGEMSRTDGQNALMALPNPLAEYREGQQDTQNAPAPGQVEDGYRFKGGDPADPASWERI